MTREPRNQQTNFMLTKTEKEELDNFAAEMGLTISAAVRLLVRNALALHAENITFVRKEQ